MDADDLVRALHDHLPPVNDPTDPPTVLDLGAGEGRWTFWLAAQGYATTSLERSAARVDAARRQMATLPFAVQNRIDGLMVGDPHDLTPFGDASFDAVVAVSRGGSVADLLLAAALWRILRPGGVLVTVGEVGGGAPLEEAGFAVLPGEASPWVCVKPSD